MKNIVNKVDKKVSPQKRNRYSRETVIETKKDCRNIFVEELKEIYFSEKALIISIPILIKNAATEELADALKVHLQFTLDHIKRLEDFFISIGETDIILKYIAMYGISTPQKA
jgi:ferritin-like metal-binding protein YciE